MTGGNPTDEPTRAGLEDFTGAAEGSNSDFGEGVGCTMTEGSPTDGTMTAGLDETTSGLSL
jgi:hypothetical protein